MSPLVERVNRFEQILELSIEFEDAFVRERFATATRLRSARKVSHPQKEERT